MSAWQRIYDYRVWIFPFVLLFYAIGLSIIEAKNEASEIAAFVIASGVGILVHWYVGWLSFRLWGAIPKSNKEVARRNGQRSVTPVRMETQEQARRRSYHSLGAWMDAWVSLVLAWAFWSQATFVVWPEVFETHHLSHNQWAASFQWMESLLGQAVSIGPSQLSAHPAMSAAYSINRVLFYFYDRIVMAIAVIAIWEYVRSLIKAEKKLAKDVEQGTGGSQLVPDPVAPSQWGLSAEYSSVAGNPPQLHQPYYQHQAFSQNPSAPQSSVPYQRNAAARCYQPQTDPAAYLDATQYGHPPPLSEKPKPIMRPHGLAPASDPFSQ